MKLNKINGKWDIEIKKDKKILIIGTHVYVILKLMKYRTPQQG